MRQFPELFGKRDIDLAHTKEVLGHQATDTAEYMKSKGHEIPSMRAEPVQYWTDQHRKNLEHCKSLEESGVRPNPKYLREDQNELLPQDLIEDLISSMPTTSWTSPEHDESAVPSRQCIEASNPACCHGARRPGGDIKTANPHIFSTDPELDDHILSGCIPPFWAEAWSQKIGDPLPDAVSNRTESLTIWCDIHERLETFNRPPWFIVAFACGLLTREKWIEVAIGTQLDGWVKLVGSHTCGNGLG
ncbi:hypothetical protein PRZ48_001803 [Zasmidium cellare]|uniref:Uncharacterized protein n=1 Tax=Zasmidium cellare TaxID=395010 RepID=A0ABR0F291_ZASCE|nr:hypothetical protein PRZ48_001803 [Zasmidium cellare]